VSLLGGPASEAPGAANEPQVSFTNTISLIGRLIEYQRRKPGF